MSAPVRGSSAKRTSDAGDNGMANIASALANATKSTNAAGGAASMSKGPTGAMMSSAISSFTIATGFSDGGGGGGGGKGAGKGAGKSELAPKPTKIGNAAPAVADLANSRIKDAIQKSMQMEIGQNSTDPHPLFQLGLGNGEEVVINRGRFSWFSAVCMSLFVITAFSALILMALALRNTSIRLESEEISYIDAPNPPWDVPPWGFTLQPNNAEKRSIGQPFRFAMPTFTLFYSVFSASFGLFTVAYFCSELLVQDIGVQRVKNIGVVITKGVDTYILRSMPITWMMMIMIAAVVYFVADINFVLAMSFGAAMCISCTNMGINMNFQGGTRLAHAMNYDLPGSIQLAIRTGAIGGLSAHAMAQLGVVMVWTIVREANALVGFAMGASIVGFYTRVAGGIFAKGCDIGSDFVSSMLGEDIDDYNMDNIDALRVGLADKDGDGDVDEDYAERQMARDPNAYVEDEELNFITDEEAKVRSRIEKEMEKTLVTMHPVNYLDAIGENIADIGGTSSDLFETMCTTLATAVILGSKAHEVPYFGTSLPFNIISTGTIGCSMVSYYVWAHEKHTSTRIRRHLQLNLFIVMIIVQSVVAFSCYLQYKVYRTISWDRFINYNAVVALGLCAPEACAAICEYFTSVNFKPVAWIAQDANLGMIQVVLRGLGQGFASAGLPSVVNILVQILAFQWEGFYGLVLLACASQACTGWQATLAAFGAVANNTNRLVHLTTVNEMAHHRANVCATIGTTTSHNGKVIAGQNCFFATTALLGALLADKYTKLGLNFKQTVGQEVSEFTRAGLLASIIFTMLFLANTLTGCINMAKSIVGFCKENADVAPRTDRHFPASHIKPLSILVKFAAVECFRLTVSPIVQSLGAPLVIGQLFGFKGLLMLVSGGNSVCFSLNMFLINSGQAWDAARKYILFGMLKDEKGNLVGAESEVYDTLGIGEQIGGPLEDLTGPALNNFIKFVSLVSFVSSGVYDLTPAKSWPWGLLQIFVNFVMVSFFKWGLGRAVTLVEDLLRRRRERIEFEEGTLMLKEMDAKEREIEERLRLQDGDQDEEVALY